eukprot:3038339-Rhodomonas_salina.1
MDGAVDIPRAEATSLAERLVAGDGQIDYLQFIGVVRDARKQRCDRDEKIAFEVSLALTSNPDINADADRGPASSSTSPVKQKLAFGAPANA